MNVARRPRSLFKIGLPSDKADGKSLFVSLLVSLSLSSFPSPYLSSSLFADGLGGTILYLSSSQKGWRRIIGDKRYAMTDGWYEVDSIRYDFFKGPVLFLRERVVVGRSDGRLPDEVVIVFAYES